MNLLAFRQQSYLIGSTTGGLAILTYSRPFQALFTIFALLCLVPFAQGSDEPEVSETIQRCRDRIASARQHRRLMEGLNLAYGVTTQTTQVFDPATQKRTKVRRFVPLMRRNGNHYGIIDAEASDDLQTLRYRHQEGLIPVGINGLVLEDGEFKNSPINRPTKKKLKKGRKENEGPKIQYDTVLHPTRVRLPAFHGAGGLNSQGGSWFDFMNMMMSPSAEIGSMALELKMLRDWTPAAVEAIDLPGYGVGLPLDDFLDIKNMVGYAIKWLELMRRESSLPIVPVARSAASGVLLAVAQLRPDLLDGLIVISPVHPSVGFERNVKEGYKHAHETGEFFVASSDERRHWIREKLEAHILKPIDPEWALERNVQEIEVLINKKGGFPGTSELDRGTWFEAMVHENLFDHSALPHLGDLPGGTEEQQLTWYKRQRTEGKFIPNIPGLEACFSWYRQLDAFDADSPYAWHKKKHAQNGVPTLYLIGNDDWQVPDGTGRLSGDEGEAHAPPIDQTEFVRQHGIYENEQVRKEKESDRMWVYTLGANREPKFIRRYRESEDVRHAFREHARNASHPLTVYRQYASISHDVVSTAHPSAKGDGQKNKELVFQVYSEVHRFLHDVLAYRNLGRYYSMP